MPDNAPDAGMARWIHPAAILVATDLSDLDRLMPFAFEQASEAGARLILLHVLASTAAISADAAGMPYYDPAGALEFAAKTLEPWCALARRQNIACDALVREGQPARQIEASILQFQADRVLLGTRSRSRLGKMLVGSVAEQVLRSVNLPVMTVGPEAHLLVEDGDRERVVLYATTLRETSRPSAALACRIAASQAARLVLLHAVQLNIAGEERGIPRTRLLNELCRDAEFQLQQLAECMGKQVTTEALVCEGRPAGVIIEMAKRLQADTIVMSTHGCRGWLKWLHRNTALNVMRQAPCATRLVSPEKRDSTVSFARAAPSWSRMYRTADCVKM